MRYATANNVVAVAPFPERDKGGKGLQFGSATGNLVALEVVFEFHGSQTVSNLSPGDTVSVDDALRESPAGRKVHSLDGRDFILLPASEIRLVGRKPYEILPPANMVSGITQIVSNG